MGVRLGKDGFQPITRNLQFSGSNLQTQASFASGGVRWNVLARNATVWVISSKTSDAVDARPDEKQRFALWRQVRRDLRHATPDRRLEIEAFLSVLEAVLQERGYMSYVSAALSIEDRALRAARIIAVMPKESAIEVIERTQSARKAARR